MNSNDFRRPGLSVPTQAKAITTVLGKITPAQKGWM
jgi:hypothetical protein